MTALRDRSFATMYRPGKTAQIIADLATGLGMIAVGLGLIAYGLVL